MDPQEGGARAIPVQLAPDPPVAISIYEIVVTWMC